MTVKSRLKGHEIYYDGKVWRYLDTEKEVNYEGYCNKCGKPDVEMVVTIPASLSSTGKEKRKKVGIDWMILLTKDTAEIFQEYKYDIYVSN